MIAFFSKYHKNKTQQIALPETYDFIGFTDKSQHIAFFFYLALS